MSFFKNRLVSEKNIAYIALFLPVLLWLYPFFLPRNLALFPGIDGSFYFYPMTKVGMDMFRHGQIPLWTSLIHCGFPLLADGQGALLYPLNLLFFLSLPSPVANNLCIVLQLLLTTAFMYAFCRKLGTGRMSSVIAAWVWVFFGPVSVSWGSPALNGLTWWPLLFLLADHISRQCDWRHVALAGIVMGFGWLGGFPQTQFYGIAGASLFFLFRVVHRHWTHWKTGIAPVSGWIIAGITGAGIAAPQILTTLEMSRFSLRSGGADFALGSLGSMFPAGMAGFLLPGWNALFPYMLAGSNLHIGFICLAAALLTIRRKNMGALEGFLWFLVVTGCLFSMGKYTPLYKVVHALPGFSFFRYPYRFLYWTSFAMAILSARGLDRLFSPPNNPDGERRRMAAYLSGLTGLAVTASVSGTALFHALRNTMLQLARSIVNKTIVGQAYKLQDQHYYSVKINTMMADIASAISPWHSDFIVSCMLALCAAALLALTAKKTHRARNVKMAFCALIALNILGSRQGPLGPLAKTEEFRSFPLAPLCSAADGPSRLYNVNTSEEISSLTYFQRKRLDPDFNMLSGVDHVGVYSALGSSRYFDFMGPLGTVNLAIAVRATSPADAARCRPILDLCNVRFVAGKEPLDVPGFRMIHDGDPFLYKNDRCLPRAFVVPRAITVKNGPALLDSLHSPLFDPRAAVFIESDPPARRAEGESGSSAQGLSYGNRRVTMNAAGPGWLVFTETFYPGWHARVDGSETDIYRGDYVFRTLPLGPGTHRVEFYYIAKSFNDGIILLVISGAIIILLFGAGLIQARRKTNSLLSPLS